MGKIIQPPSTVWGYKTEEEKQAVRDELLGKNRIVAAIQRPDHILIAWAVDRTGYAENIRAWYLPKDGKKWVYSFYYKPKTLQEIPESFSRNTCQAIYDWLKLKKKGLFKEFHVCVPPYILLDNKELRAEYLAGNLKSSS